MSLEYLRLMFWCLATTLMVAAVLSALVGVAHVRAGRIAEHRRAMNRAVLLVVAFLVAYLLKVGWLGHESLATWSAARLTVLHLHRGVVFTMLGAGALARALGPRAARKSSPRLQALHRWSGRLAAVTGTLGLLTALIVLGQMVRAAVLG